jgi:hypothetical protein
MDQSISRPTLTKAAVARQALELDDTVQLFKLEILKKGSAPEYFIMQAPTATASTPPGHSTCVFIAYDIARRNNVLLKDSWRINLLNIHPEGLTYEMLMNASVCNIPRCLVSGDIKTNKYHATITDIYGKAKWAKMTIDTHFIPH